MRIRRFLVGRWAVLVVIAGGLGLPTPPVVAATCCAAAAGGTPWSFMAPTVAPSSAARAGGSKQFGYMVQSHWWLMGGVHALPTGVPFSPETSCANRTAYSQASLGLGYSISPTVRAISNWNTGLGRFSATPGSQFAVGVRLHY